MVSCGPNVVDVGVVINTYVGNLVIVAQLGLIKQNH